MFTKMFLHELPYAPIECLIYNAVFFAGETDCEVVAVRLQVKKKDPGANPAQHTITELKEAGLAQTPVVL